MIARPAIQAKGADPEHITADLKNGGALENVAAMATHASTLKHQGPSVRGVS